MSDDEAIENCTLPGSVFFIAIITINIFMITTTVSN